MRLLKYDNKLVRLTTLDNEVLEGPCDYNSCDYDFHEYGVDEEGIEILHHLIYKSSIKSIEEIDDYSSDYGTLEEMIILEDMDFYEDILLDEDDIIVYRLLLCMIDKIKESKFVVDEKVIKLLDEVKSLNKSKRVNDLIDNIKKL